MDNAQLIKAIAELILQYVSDNDWDLPEFAKLQKTKGFELAKLLLKVIQPRFDEIKEQADDILSVLSEHATPISYQRAKNILALCNLEPKPEPEPESMRDNLSAIINRWHRDSEIPGWKMMDEVMAIVEDTDG